MTIKKVGLISLLGLASFGGALLLGMPTSSATTRPVYVQLQPYQGRLAVYKQLPTSTSSLQNGTDVPASNQQVYRGSTTGKYLTFNYLRVQTLVGKSLGWVNRQDMKTLTHVTKAGLLTQYKVKKLTGQLTTTSTKKVTITVQGPTATATKLTTKKVTAKTLTGKTYQVVKQSNTDFGRYYQLQKNHKNYGWVRATGFKVTAAKPTATKTAAISKTALKQIDALVAANHLQGTLLLATKQSTKPTIKAYGDANTATQMKNSANTVYPIASLQKAMTGTMIEQLIQAGELSLQTPISRYYPKLKGAKTITIQQLLTHTSGITMAETHPKKTLGEAAAVTWTLSHLVSTRQHTWHYTSANYTLLAGIIRQVTGQSYAKNLQQRILTPAKLTQTFNWNELPKTTATPYAYTTADYGKAYRISKPLLSSELGAGNIAMTVDDYAKFVTAFNSGKLLTTAGHQNLTSQPVKTYAGGFYYSAAGTQHATGYDNHISNFYTRTKNGQVTVIGFWNQADHVAAKPVMKKIETILKK